MQFRSLGMFLLLVFVVLPACDGSSISVAPPDSEAGMLRAVASAAELEASIKAGLTTMTPAGQSTSTALATEPTDAGSGGFSGTYTQEPNVDEFDAVRYDGEHMYVAPRRYPDCCFILTTEVADGSDNTGNPAEASIRLLETDPSTGNAMLTSSIPLPEDVTVQGMYIDDDTLFALTAEAMFGHFGRAFTVPAYWIEERLGYRVYDTADESAPSLIADVSIDGVFVESRRIGDIVYIVSRYAPGIDGVILNPSTPAAVEQNRSVLANVTLDDLLPTITIDGQTRELVDPAQCWVSNDARVPGYPVVTSITAVPIDDPGSFTNTCIADDAYGVYVSESSIYFPQVVGYMLPDDVRTRIHKFALLPNGPTYRGSGEVEGQLWRGGQTDFRMSEHMGDLRVMPSIYRDDNADFVDHKLYVLRESASRRALDIVGELPNDARPAPIGKPNEELYGVRFLADRAYAVTFERIDPLYVLDLADPTDPAIAGELIVTGVSDFLHPVTGDLLLGLGRDELGRLKLELFDVSTISTPLSRGSLPISEPWAYSEALHNRHAFTYLADVGAVDRFAIPVEDTGDVTISSVYRPALNLFEIHDKTTPALASLVRAGRIALPVDKYFPWSTRHRAFLHDDAVYFVLDESVWSAMWHSPTIVNGPF